jgi:hypothetical protein
MYHLVFNKTIFMMLLIIVASLVRISSMYTPANVETQPQPQPQKPQTTLEARKPGLSTELTTGQRVVDPQVLRAMEENQLLNRLMPKIIDRIDVKLVATGRPGQTKIVDHGTRSPGVFVEAKCAPGETVVGGQYLATGQVYTYDSRSDINGWRIGAEFDQDGSVGVSAWCLKAEVSLKGAQQPQPQQPSPPPGGPPLQPPPEFGRK